MKSSGMNKGARGTVEKMPTNESIKVAQTKTSAPSGQKIVMFGQILTNKSTFGTKQI
jgi:hypothetical protein